MKRHLKHRLRARDGDPGPLAWVIAAISLVLPVAGLVLCLVGGAQLMRGEAGGWQLLACGGALLIIDILIDFAWAHPGVSESDQPDLNRRGDQLIGRTVLVEQAIEGGRGKVRIGDTLWVAEGPDMTAGTTAQVVGSRLTLLIVEPGAGERRP